MRRESVEFVERVLERKVFLTLVADIIGEEVDLKVSKSQLQLINFLKEDDELRRIIKEFLKCFDYGYTWYSVDMYRRAIKRENTFYYLQRAKEGKIKNLKDIPTAIRDLFYKKDKVYVRDIGKVVYRLLVRLMELGEKEKQKKIIKEVSNE